MKRKRVNEFELMENGKTAKVFLNKGFVTFIDSEDLPLILPYVWHVKIDEKRAVKYAVAGIYKKNQPHKIIRMHRLVMDDPKDLQVDHQDNDGLNNRKSNLRLATNTQNNQNKEKLLRNTTGFKGVVFHKKAKKFLAEIKSNGKYLYLGLYPTAEQAAIVYDQKAIEFHGEFARLNFPQNKEQK